ncbi:MAG: response regulator transcription factor [Bacteroidales bacterium]|jgi:DNA-binding response OmpR family regulator|nr:response regulator transcription factor [Bacteroidales bacterium]MDD4215547.1 response regulator transcription factor [Bacteroidales bacterium]
MNTTSHKSNKTKILLVEDDPNLSLVLKDYLEILMYETVFADNGEDALNLFNSQYFDLIILDVMLPKKDGFSIAKDIRKTNKEIPIIFLTAKTLKEDRIKGFQLGCDDYITKPFSTEELSLRIEAILRRSKKKQLFPLIDNKEVYELSSLNFDYTNMVLKSSSGEQYLTRKEADLLKLLCVNKNRLVHREIALKSIWGDSDYFTGRSMDVFITRLRKYLKDEENISITNVHGTGFKLEVKE